MYSVNERLIVGSVKSQQILKSPYTLFCYSVYMTHQHLCARSNQIPLRPANVAAMIINQFAAEYLFLSCLCYVGIELGKSKVHVLAVRYPTNERVLLFMTVRQRARQQFQVVLRESLLGWADEYVFESGPFVKRTYMDTNMAHHRRC